MQSITATVDGVVRHCVARLRVLFTIPPRSESMAGVIILFVFLNSMATSIWMFNAWTPFVYLLFNHSNFAVGVVSGVNGAFELAFAMLSGHMADKVWGPSRTLVFAVRMGMVNLCVVLLAVWVQQQWMLILAQVFEGCYMGLSLTCVESVFAQCLRTGERDRLYSVKFSAESFGPIVGLISSILLYLVVGTDWNVRVLQVVMTCGLVLHFTSMLLFATSFVPLPSHLDRRTEAMDAGGRTVPQPGSESVTVPSIGPSRRYDVEDKRVKDLMGSQQVEIEAEELSPSNLVQRSSTELINRARTSIMHATNYNTPPPLVSRYEPSVCTARNDEAASLRAVREKAMAAPGPVSQHTTSSVGNDAQTATSGMEDDAGEDWSATMRSFPHLSQSTTSATNTKKIPPGAHVEYVDQEYAEASGCRRAVMRCLPLRIYPFAIVLCDLILILGSGMTTQYFSLFMMERYGVSLATVSALNLCNSLVISCMAILTGAMGKRFGRIRAIIPPKMVGATLLLYMALAQGTRYGPKVWMCVAYVFRNAFMNCSAGLSRALIMDLVPEERRGRWNALESVQSAGWSGSAILGGLMADKSGYGAAFIFTFCFHIVSTSALIPFAIRNDSRLPQPVLVYDAVSGRTAEGQELARVPPASDVVVVALTAENVRKIASCVSLNVEMGGSNTAPHEKRSRSPKSASADRNSTS